MLVDRKIAFALADEARVIYKCADPKIQEYHLAVEDAAREEYFPRLEAHNRCAHAYLHFARAGFNIELIEDAILECAIAHLKWLPPSVNFFNSAPAERVAAYPKARADNDTQASPPSRPPTGSTTPSSPFCLS